MKHGADRPPTTRRRGRLIIALAMGTALVAGLVVAAQVSVADVDRSGRRPLFPALAEAARIPNDQGPPPECAGTPPPTTAQPTAPPPTDVPPTDAPPTDAPPTDAPPEITAEPPSEPPATGGPEDPPVTDKPEAPPAEEPAAVAPAAAADHSNHTQSRRGGRGGVPPSCHEDLGGPLASDFISIFRVPPSARAPRPAATGSRGTFVSQCGRNENGHRNSANYIVAPGNNNGAHHTHDYVGNLSTDGNSTDASLAAAGTTCRFGDQSVYYWPVLRQRGTVGADQNADGGGNDGNVGRIIGPRSVRLEFRGNLQSTVEAMPRFIRVITGDAKAATNGPTNARAKWTCTGFSNRITTKYPLCPRGSQVQRILDFPSCWDGINTDSPNHRAHIVFPEANGACPAGTRAVPQLRMVLTYSVPPGRSFALDTFPEQLHNPITDHGDFSNIMPDRLMRFAIDCINRGRRC